MSAFMMNEKSIANIAAYMARNSEFAEEKNLNYQQMFLMLEDMNIQALVARYGDDPEELKYGIFPQDPGVPEDLEGKVQLHKTMACYLYQCSEGKVPEWELYKEVRRCKYEFADDILAGLPMWEEAKWD